MFHASGPRTQGYHGEVVGERTADEILHREIINTFGILALIIRFFRGHPALREHIADGQARKRPQNVHARHERSHIPYVVKNEMAPLIQTVRPGEPDHVASVLLKQTGRIFRAGIRRGSCLLRRTRCIHGRQVVIHPDVS